MADAEGAFSQAAAKLRVNNLTANWASDSDDDVAGVGDLQYICRAELTEACIARSARLRSRSDRMKPKAENVIYAIATKPPMNKANGAIRTRER